MRYNHAFGSECTIHVEGQKQKFDRRGESGIYLGVNPLNGAYFVLKPDKNRVVTSLNVLLQSRKQDETESDYETLPLPQRNYENTDKSNKEKSNNEPVTESGEK